MERLTLEQWRLLAGEDEVACVIGGRVVFAGREIYRRGGYVGIEDGSRVDEAAEPLVYTKTTGPVKTGCGCAK